MLTKLQNAVASELATVAQLSEVTILVESKGDLSAMIDEAIAKLGLFLVVLTPSAKVESPNVPGPLLDPLSVAVAAYDNPPLRPEDSPLPFASGAALLALQKLHLWTPPGFPAPLRAARQALGLKPDPELVVYQVNLETTLNLQPKSDPRRAR